MKKQYATIIYLLVALVVGGAMFFINLSDRENVADDLEVSPVKRPAQTEPIAPIQQVNLDEKRVKLGRKLFEDTRLSHDNTIACSNCHDLKRGGVDGLSHSIGIHGAIGGINAPTVYNSGLNFVQFWDGRAVSLEDQVNGPIAHPAEMGSGWDEIVGKLRQDAGYVAEFTAAYSDGMTPANIRHAIAEFERSLQTPSRFDRWLLGDHSAISEQEVEGYRLFVRYGCVACHQGRNVGGNMYQKFGVVGDYFQDRGNVTEADMGRYNVTHIESDRHVFKVPTLRNIALTAPYFHDGSANTLDDAVKIMGRYQLGVEIPDADRERLIAFLHTLTGEELRQ